MKQSIKINIHKVMALLFIMGFVALFSCESQEEIAPSPAVASEGDFDALSNDAGRLSVSSSSCTGGTDVTLNGTIDLSGTQLIEYCTAGRLTYTLCGSAPELAFEGQFNSFIRPLTGGWAIGTIPLSQYNNNWATMSFTPKFGNLGPDPNENCGSFTATPANVVGLDGAFTPPGSPFPVANFGEGYYEYNPVTNVPDPTKAIVIWRGPGSVPNNPAAAAEGYVIRVDQLNAIPQNFPPSIFRSQVVFDYRKAR